VGEGFAFRRWMLHWGYAYGSKLTNESALWVWQQKKVRS